MGRLTWRRLSLLSSVVLDPRPGTSGICRIESPCGLLNESEDDPNAASWQAYVGFTYLVNGHEDLERNGLSTPTSTMIRELGPMRLWGRMVRWKSSIASLR